MVHLQNQCHAHRGVRLNWALENRTQPPAMTQFNQSARTKVRKVSNPFTATQGISIQIR
jgi:hypothetical protein